MSKAININKNSFFAIEGSDNSCYLNILFRLKNIFSKKELLFITTKNIDFLKNDLKKIQNNFENFDLLNLNIRYLFLKDDFYKLYKEYGSEFLIKEITTLIGEDEIDMIYFHKIDFLLQEQDDYKNVLINIISNIKYHNKKFVCSYNLDSSNGSTIAKVIEDDIDVKLLLNSNNKRCNYDIVSKENLKIESKVVFVSESDEIFKVHSYVFRENQNINFLYINPNDIEKNIHDVFYATNIMIYKGSNHSIVNTIVKHIKSTNLDMKFIYICESDYIRKADSREFKRLGIYKIFNENFNLDEYLYTLSDLFKNNHYYTKIRLLSENKNKTLTTKRNFFEDYIQYMVDQTIFFSILLFKIKNDSHITNDKLKYLIRDQDFIYLDKKENTLIFVFTNLLSSRVKKLIQTRALKEQIHISFEQELTSIDI